MFHPKLIYHAAILLILVLPTIAAVYGDSFNPGVYAIESKPYGLTYGEWSAKWWQWLLGIPADRNPLADPSGKYCAERQSGPVWFLAGFDGKTERTCSVPLGKAIFVPILSTECSVAEYPQYNTDDARLGCAEREMHGGGEEVEVTLNGSPLLNLKNYRAIAKSFEFTFPTNSIFNIAPGPTVAASDGYYIMLEPLPAGTHKLHVKGVDTNFVTDVAYTLIVK